MKRLAKNNRPTGWFINISWLVYWYTKIEIKLEPEIKVKKLILKPKQRVYVVLKDILKF